MDTLFDLEKFNAGLTQAEIDAPDYLDWNDVRLGQFVRAVVVEIMKRRKTREVTSLPFAIAAKILINFCIEEKLKHVSQEWIVPGHGKFIVEIRQKEK